MVQEEKQEEPPVSKAQVLFYLTRRRNEVTELILVPDDVALAKAGVPYARRQEIHEKQKKAYEQSVLELRCYEKAIELVERYG